MPLRFRRRYKSSCGIPAKNDKRQIPWNANAESAFEQLKQGLTNAALLAHPTHDAKTRLVTDASNFGMGASPSSSSWLWQLAILQIAISKGMGTSLEQWRDNSWKPLAFFSRKFSASQRVYSA